MGREEKLNPVAQQTSGGTIVKDAKGRELGVGDEIILTRAQVIPFRVAGITPLLDPNFPPNSLRIDLMSMSVFVAARGSINAEFLLVQQAPQDVPTEEKLVTE